ncbi:uncharacterized protein [Periplaneta americana]|uniref:uncharacterized protein isoform X2 n=1 Tax=Periplaneta americana TaxID=6978 RepID=UPI0037E9668D
MEDDVGATVELFIYDLTKGMARMMSQMLLGHQVDGIWHTAIVAYGREYFFGSGGVQSCRPSGTILGEPDQILNLGETFIPYQVFLEYVLGLGETTFSPGAYDLFKHNCNNFTNEVSQFLCGKGIPKYILDVPEEILSTPIGQSLRPLIDSLSEGARGVTFGQNASNGLRDYEPQSRRERAESPDFLELNTAIDEVRRNSVALEERRNVINEKLAKKERKKKKKREKREKGRESGGSSSAELTPDSCSSTTELTPDSCCSSSRNSSRRPSNMADSEAADVIELTANGSDESNKKSPADVAAEIEEQEAREKKEREERKKNREPPIVYKDAVDVRVDFDALVGLVDGILGPEEQQSLEELHQYMLEDEGSWALGDGFLNFVGRLLHDKSLKPEIRVRILNVLAAAALKDDVILLLHQDRREHVLMNYAHDVDRLSIEEQEALALFICNMFENLSSSEWLLYISEWQYCNTTISNIRCTTKVAVNSLLSDNAVLQERGSAIIHNLACKEVFDDVAVELTMALLQYFNSNPPEEQIFRCMKALNRFCQISQQDVPQLIQMIGPEPAKFRGTSARVDDLIAQINKRLR